MALFDDFFSSSKGPGAIATFLALFVLASFTGLGFLVFDGRFNGDQANTLLEDVKTQDLHIGRLKAMAVELEGDIVNAREQAKVQDEVERLLRILADKQRILAELETNVADAKETLSGTQQSWEDYKNDYRAAERAKVVGLKIGELTTLDGEVFKNITVRSLDNLSMRIMHESGSTSIKWDQLPLDMQDRFQFDKNQAAEAAAAAAARKEAWDDQVRSGSTAKKAAALKNHILLKQHEIEKLQRTIKNNIGLMASNTNSIANYKRLAAEARSRHSIAVAAGRRSSHLATATRMETSAASKERSNITIADNNRTAEAKIREVEQEIREIEQQISDLNSSATEE